MHAIATWFWPQASTAELTQGRISPERKLIVLHTPRCGGTSLFASLQAVFGVEQIYRDYQQGGDPKVASIQEVKQPIIYGHFRANKYEALDHAMWITLLRDPVDRMMSLYFNWRYAEIEPQDRVSPLRQDVRLGKIGLLDFAKIPNRSHQLSGALFVNFDMKRFDLIILQDNYAEGVARFGEKLGVPLRVKARNVSSSKSSEYDSARQRVLKDPAVMQQLKEILRDEIKFYERCLELPSVVRPRATRSD